LILRGSARTVATRHRSARVCDPADADRTAWQQLRAALEDRSRFRRDLNGFAQHLEEKHNRSHLPM
jgi:hypothetical protein